MVFSPRLRRIGFVWRNVLKGPPRRPSSISARLGKVALFVHPARKLASFCAIEPMPETLFLCPPGHTTNGDRTRSDLGIGFVFTDTRSTLFFHNLFHDQQLVSIESSWKLASFRRKGLETRAFPRLVPLAASVAGRAIPDLFARLKLASFRTICPPRPEGRPCPPSARQDKSALFCTIAPG